MQPADVGERNRMRNQSFWLSSICLQTEALGSPGENGSFVQVHDPFFRACSMNAASKEASAKKRPHTREQVGKFAWLRMFALCCNDMIMHPMIAAKSRIMHREDTPDPTVLGLS